MSNVFYSNQDKQKNHQHDQIQENLSPSQIVLFSRINNHLLFHFLPLVEFWDSSRLCVTISQFQNMLQKLNFTKGKDQIQQMKQYGVQFISLDKLLIGVNQWKRHDHDIATFLERQKEYKQTQEAKSNRKINRRQMIGSSNKNIDSSNKKAIKSDNLGKFLNISDQTSNKNNNQKQSAPGISSRITKVTNNSISNHYLVQQQKRKQQALKNLNSNLIRTKNQSNYELTIKIGELNDICKKLKNDLSYLIITSQQNNQLQIIQKSSKSSQSKVISQKVFQKKYQQLKTLNNNIMEQIEGTLQKDLRQTLVEVMFLSDQLQKQISLLKRKGINN